MTHCNILSLLQVLHGLLYLLNLLVLKINWSEIFIRWNFDEYQVNFDQLCLFIEILVISSLHFRFQYTLPWQNADGKLPHFSDFVFGWVFASINSLNSILLASLFWFKGSNQTKNADLRFTKLLFWTLLRSFQIQGHRK